MCPEQFLSFKIMVGCNRNGDRRIVESSSSRFPNKQGSILNQRIIEQIFTHCVVKRTGLNRDRRTVTKLHYHLLTGLKPASKNGQGPLPLLFLQA
jgi:hypothetical protein